MQQSHMLVSLFSMKLSQDNHNQQQVHSEPLQWDCFGAKCDAQAIPDNLTPKAASLSGFSGYL